MRLYTEPYLMPIMRISHEEAMSVSAEVPADIAKSILELRPTDLALLALIRGNKGVAVLKVVQRYAAWRDQETRVRRFIRYLGDHWEAAGDDDRRSKLRELAHRLDHHLANQPELAQWRDAS